MQYTVSVGHRWLQDRQRSASNSRRRGTLVKLYSRMRFLFWEGKLLHTSMRLSVGTTDWSLTIEFRARSFLAMHLGLST